MFHSKKIWIFFLTIFLMFSLLVISVLADHNEGKPYHLLNEVYTMYELSESDKYEAARNKLDDILEAVNSGHLSVQEDKRSYIVEVIISTKAELNSDALSDEMKKESAYRFVLMIETIKNPNNSTYNEFVSQLQEQILNTLESETMEFDSEYRNTINLYHTLLPAIKMDKPISDWENYDRQLDLLINVKNYEEKEQGLYVLLNMFEPEEVSTDKKDEDPSFFWVISTVGGAIVFTLIYVGWRKYKGEKKSKKYKKVDGL